MAGAAGIFIGAVFALYPAMGGHTVMKGFAILEVHGTQIGIQEVQVILVVLDQQMV